MNQVHSAAPEGTVHRDPKMVELLIVLAKRKKLILWLPFGLATLAAALSFVLPNIYHATTRVMPPQQAQAGAAALLASLGGAGGMVAGAAGLKSPNDMYIGMLGSRTIGERLVSRFDLKKVYDTESLEKALEHLKNDTSLTTGKDGLIVIEVESKDKKLVAPLTNAYVDELGKLTRVLAVTEAGQRRLFFERQLEQAKNNLANAEATLKKTLDTQGVISIDNDSRALLEITGRLRAQVSAKEAQIGAMQAFITPNNPEYKRAQEELVSLRAELDKIENGRPGQQSRATPAGAGKSDGLENIKVLREVKYYQMLYELLAKQYEAARLDEAREGAVIHVLDPAVEPERKYKPKRLLIVLMAGLFGVFAAVFAAFGLEARERALESPEEALLWQRLSSYLRGKPGK
jgi:uncharacterized protein involved in exopolysaccharide biosynthesis